MTTADEMRAWRSTPRGQRSLRAATLARDAALSWVKNEHPAVWLEMRRAAREAVGLPNEITPGGRLGKPISHGTPQGARAHYRRGEKPCEECRLAFNASSRAHTKETA